MSERKIYAITGGIGSGKSFVCQIIESKGFPVFYCDDEAKHIIRHDEAVRTALANLVGKHLYNPEGALQKPVLAAYLCQGKEYSKQVDTIVHPRVAETFKRWIETQTASNIFMECALLFESGFDCLVDETITILTPKELRIQRIMARDKVSREKAIGWMELQLPEEEKTNRARHIIYNDDKHDLNQQIEEILNL